MRPFARLQSLARSKAFSATATNPWCRAITGEIRDRPLLTGFPLWSSEAGWSKFLRGTTTNGAFLTASSIWRFSWKSGDSDKRYRILKLGFAVDWHTPHRRTTDSTQIIHFEAQS